MGRALKKQRSLIVKVAFAVRLPGTSVGNATRPGSGEIFRNSPRFRYKMCLNDVRALLRWSNMMADDSESPISERKWNNFDDSQNRLCKLPNIMKPYTFLSFYGTHKIYSQCMTGRSTCPLDIQDIVRAEGGTYNTSNERKLFQ